MTAASEDGTPADTTPIQLTRMEGTLNLINFQLAAMTPRVDDHERRLSITELMVQRLGDAAAADKLTVEQTARALKDAKEAADATARAELQKSETAFSPVARLATAAAILSSLVAFYFAIRPNG